MSALTVAKSALVVWVVFLAAVVFILSKCAAQPEPGFPNVLETPNLQ